MFTTLSVTLDSARDRIEKILVAKRLGEKIDSAGFHGPHRHGDIAMSRYKHDWNSNISLDQLSLEVETAQSRQSHVEHEAAWNIRARPAQELLRRRKDFHPQLNRVKKPRKRLTHRCVIVYDKHDRLVCASGGLR